MEAPIPKAKSSIIKPKKVKGPSEAERRAEALLKGLGVQYLSQVRLPGLKDKKLLVIDFVIFVNGRVGIIETDGEAHFHLVPVFHKRGEVDFINQKRRDVIKNRFTRDEGISLLRIAYTEDARIEQFITDFIASMKKANARIATFSSPLMYPDPYEENNTTGGCGIM
jgi:hypothetical protein